MQLKFRKSEDLSVLRFRRAPDESSICWRHKGQSHPVPIRRFNNTGDERIRRWILAVVGLHDKIFKPHTGTKTSVLFIQTWNEDKKAGLLNPRVDDYPVFMATSERPGKDNSGDYVYRIGTDNAPVLDKHHHMIVEHDLEKIADEFIVWGRKLKLPFCEGADSWLSGAK